jgi:hypothetical protein
MNRVNVLANGLEAAKTAKTTFRHATAFRRASRRTAELFADMVEEAGSVRAVQDLCQTATEDEEEQAQLALGWTPNPDNVAALLAFISQLMAMFAASKV